MNGDNTIPDRLARGENSPILPPESNWHINRMALTQLPMQSCEVVPPFALADGSACGPDLMRINDGGYVPSADRRGKMRLALSWTIYLLRSTDAYPLESKTTNVSCSGFYCFVVEPFVVGECLRCTMMIPSFGVHRAEDHLTLECRATVLRVDRLENGKHGLGCRIDDYSVVLPTSRNDP